MCAPSCELRDLGGEGHASAPPRRLNPKVAPATGAEAGATLETATIERTRHGMFYYATGDTALARRDRAGAVAALPVMRFAGRAAIIGRLRGRLRRQFGRRLTAGSRTVTPMRKQPRRRRGPVLRGRRRLHRRQRRRDHMRRSTRPEIQVLPRTYHVPIPPEPPAVPWPHGTQEAENTAQEFRRSAQVREHVRDHHCA